MHQLFGMNVVTTPHLTKTVKDWSKVRSPSRAARRLRRGHRQNITTRTVPSEEFVVLDGRMYAHPETFRQLVERMDREGHLTDATMNVLHLPPSRPSPWQTHYPLF